MGNSNMTANNRGSSPSVPPCSFNRQQKTADSSSLRTLIIIFVMDYFYLLLFLLRTKSFFFGYSKNRGRLNVKLKKKSVILPKTHY